MRSKPAIRNARVPGRLRFAGIRVEGSILVTRTARSPTLTIGRMIRPQVSRPRVSRWLARRFEREFARRFEGGTGGFGASGPVTPTRPPPALRLGPGAPVRGGPFPTGLCPVRDGGPVAGPAGRPLGAHVA